MNGFFRLIIMLSFVTNLASCSIYHPKPLNDADLTKVLMAPDKKVLAAQAANMHHPRLSPIKLDFSKPLTAQELSVIAVITNHDLQALRAKEGVANAQVFSAGLLPDPQLSYSYSHPFNLMPNVVIAYQAGINWDVASLLTRLLKVKISSAQRDQVHYDVAWQEWLIANQVELLATRSYFLQQQINLVKESMHSVKQLLDVTRRNLSRHDAKIDEFGLQQSAYLDLQDQLQILARALEKTDQQLKQTLGLPPATHLLLGIKINPIPSHLDSEALFIEASITRLDLYALKAGYLSQEAQVYQGILGQFPHFSLGGNRARDNTGINAWGGDINFDLPIFNRNRGVISIAKATREQLYQEYIARLHQTRADIATLVADLNLIQQQKSILKKVLPEMIKTEKLMREGMLSGNVTLINYEVVRANLLNKKLKLLLLKQDGSEQTIALQVALGKSLYSQEK
jgi:cobalt-zinc-cadmium efflux system outer membrane protein